jgi:hypothetical protein
VHIKTAAERVEGTAQHSTLSLVSDSTSESEGRGPSDEEKKPREAIDIGAGREEISERDAYRHVCGTACVVEAERENEATSPGCRWNFEAVAVLNVKNAERGATSDARA